MAADLVNLLTAHLLLPGETHSSQFRDRWS